MNTAIVGKKLPEETDYLKRISQKSDGLIIDPTEGKRTFLTECNRFVHRAETSWEDWHRTNHPSDPTPRIIPVVYEIIRNGKFTEILEPFGEIWTSQDPILSFVEKYLDWPHPDDENRYFPFLSRTSTFVASVHRFGGELEAAIQDLGFDTGWLTKGRRYLVLPQVVPPEP